MLTANGPDVSYRPGGDQHYHNHSPSVRNPVAGEGITMREMRRTRWLRRLLQFACCSVVGIMSAGSAPLSVQPDAAALQEQVEYPAKVSAVVLPESAFLEAMASAHFRVDLATSQRAVALSAQANAPGTLGAVFSIDEGAGPKTFDGTIFVVVRESVVARPGTRTTVRDYYVAAVELKGQSSWLANSLAFVVNTGQASAASAGGSCCGTNTVCVPDLPEPGPCGPEGFCTGPGFGVTATMPTGPGWQQNAAAPSVPLKVFQSGTANPQATLFSGACIDRTVNRSCGISKPLCEPRDAGFIDTGGTADIDVGSACSSTTRPVNGKEIPEWCQYALFDSPNAPECRGARFENIRASLERVAGSATLPEDYVPPMCDRARVTEDSNICTTASEKQQVKALEEASIRATYGFLGGKRCEPTGRLVSDSRGRWGLNECTECEPGLTGKCRRWMELTSIDAAKSKPAENTAPKVTKVNFGEGLEIVGDAVKNGEEQKKKEVSDKTAKQTSDPPADPERNTNKDTPQPPDPNKPKPNSGEGARQTSDLNLPPSRQDGQKGDPILLGDGSFDLTQTDLSFPGPVRPLEFTRTYNSRSEDRSALGSNWVHNWDLWLEPLSVHNTPTWAMPYCLGTDAGSTPRVGSGPPGAEPRTTCIVLHRGDSSAQLFFLDLGTYLYMPQAGSTDTITSTVDGGWALRTRDGEIQRFNSIGFLVEQRDRFGNGFVLDYEPTPLWELYTYYCNPAQLQQRNETKHGRRCAFIAYLVGDAPATSGLPGWQVTAADYPLPDDIDLRPRLDYAVSYFLYLNGRGPETLAPYGTRRLRLTKVTDDLGRTLTFSYTRAPRCVPPVFCAGGSRYDFLNTPHAELLEAVSGPAGSTVRFAYDSPPKTSVDFLEMFLTGIFRSDTAGAVDVVPAAGRSFTYHYQWPGGPVTSFDAYAQKVYDKYREFYATFVGCGFVPLDPCGQRGRPQIAPGSPDRLARIAQFEYMGDVADNIIRVDDTPRPSGSLIAGRLPSIQSETRYETDPWSLSFDRAYAQRYGSAAAIQDPSRIDPDRPGDNWASSLPKATFSYSAARVAKLPAQIQSRYPLEAAPPSTKTVLIPPVGALASGSKTASCNYSRMEQLRTELPGWTPPVEYFESPAATARIDLPLASTPLSCQQLSAAVYGDPTHNDLMSTLDPVEQTPELSDHIVRRIVGRRPITGANGNRICAWTQMRDRDGDLHVYGMNFRGQILVDAVEVRPAAGPPASGTFLYSETLYNPDGMPMQRRRTVRGLQQWRPIDGYDRFTFDEIDPTGNRGWDEWLPAFWARRMNLLRLDVHPRGGQVVDFDENARAFARIAGRYQSFAYEPLFNQLRKTEYGALVRTTNAAGAQVLSDVPHERTTIVFDYQELSAVAGAPADRALAPVLDSVRGWGYGWTTNTAGAYDLNDIVTWQLPLPFFSTDLNGDGAIGFGSGSGAERLARGAPVAITREGNDPAFPPQVRLFAWAPHGQPAQLSGPDGELITFDYYSTQSPTSTTTGFGGTSPPTDADVNHDRAGFVGRTRVLRFAPYSAGAGPGIAPCTALAGPYQALLPSNCSDPASELARLGLPKQAIDAVLAAARAAGSVSDPERFETSSYAYNATGHPRYRWSEAHAHQFVRDTDGRVVRQTDPRGTTTDTAYSTQGFPVRMVVADAKGQSLAEISRAFDANGSLVWDCVAHTAGGCASATPSGSVRTFTYWPEGALREATDPEGLVSMFTYDERGMLVSERARNPNSPADIPMRTTFTYDNDGNVLSATYAAGRSEQQAEVFRYDGLQRLATHTDTREYAWQYGHTSRDRLARRKRDDVPYDVGTPKPSAWETVLSYDSYNYLARQQHNGIETLRLRRTRGGRTFAHSATGVGQTVVTYDRTGRPAWMRDPTGTVTVFTHRTAGNERTTTVIRRSGTQQLTTSTIQQLNATGEVTQETEYGSGRDKPTSWVRDGLGRVTSETNPDGFVTRLHYDLPGLLRTQERQRTPGPNPQFDVTTYDYDLRGQIRHITDPAKQITEFLYDGFGRLKERRVPGQPLVLTAFTYDGLGRVDVETSGGNRIRRVYDKRGDHIEDWWLVNPKPVLIAERTFDDLGRMRTARNSNPAVASVPLTRRTVVQELTYDPLGRVATESLRVGVGTAHTVTSSWSVALGGLWQRTLSYDLGAARSEWFETFDASRRLSQVRSASGLETQFSWLGEHYAGRAQQQQPGWQSPFREQLSFDPFGRAAVWRYTAIDVDANRRPLNPQEGAIYCGGVWNTTECSRALMSTDALRDRMGRIVSVQPSFGHPLFSGGALSPRTPAQPWRGYGYDPAGRLQDLWEHAGTGTVVSTQGLTTHTVQPADIQRIAAGADNFVYQREIDVGGTTSIRNLGSGDERFALPTPRGPGHQLQQVRIDRTPRSVQHNAAGQVREDGGLQLSFDPRGYLATVARAGQIVESYFYDASGRLAGVGAPGSGAPNQVFAYDGVQMVAAMSASNQPLWEAVWGPGVDRLVLWRDLVNGVDHTVLADYRNSVAATWNAAAGRIVNTADYDPEGRLTLRDPAGNVACSERSSGAVCASPGRMPFAFATAWRSSATGLVHMRHRWYSPELAQFISHDPLGYVDSYNAYAYAGFDPINRADPFGLSAAEKWTADVVEAAGRGALRVIQEGAEQTAAAGQNLARMAGTLAGRLAVAASVLIATNDTSPSCVDDFCKNLGGMTAYDARTGQAVTGREQAARASLPEEHPSPLPSAPVPPPPQVPVASKKDHRKGLEGPLYRQLRSELEVGDVCEFCSEATTADNPPTVEHFIALQHLSELIKGGLLTEDEAKQIADALENFYIVCRSCNSQKSNTPIGRGKFEGDERFWWPKNPNARVRAALEHLEGKGIPGTGLKPPAGTPKGAAGLVGAAGKGGAGRDAGAAGPACSPKDLACAK